MKNNKNNSESLEEVISSTPFKKVIIFQKYQI